MALRHWLLALAVAALVASSVGGTGAFSTASLDRDISVSVVPPEDGYLGLEVPPVTPIPPEGMRATLVEVTNQFGTGVTLELTVAVTEADRNTGPSVSNAVVDSPLAPGASGDVTADLSCDSAGTEVVTVSLVAVGDGVRVEGASVSVELTCTSGGDDEDDGEDDDSDEEEEDDEDDDEDDGENDGGDDGDEDDEDDSEDDEDEDEDEDD